jgi:hypothetical protein
MNVAARVEVLKWVGLFCMLVDHLARFLDVRWPGADWLGRLAFPCFAVACAFQVAVDRRLAVAARLVAWGLLLTPVEWLVTGHVVGSVLVTLGLGLVVADFWEVEQGVGLGALVLSVAAAQFVEYGAAGVLLVAGLSLRRRAGGVVLACAGAALLVYRAGVWGAPVTAAAVALVGAYLMTDGVSCPRVKGFFLRAYAAQWVVLGALALVRP